MTFSRVDINAIVDALDGVLFSVSCQVVALSAVNSL